MADPENVDLWADADLFVAPLATANPIDIDAAFGVGWEQVGLLDGDAGYTTSQNEDRTDYFAWGGIYLRTSSRNYKMERTFTLLEDNAVTRDLIWPGSTTTEIFVPRPKRIKLGFEVRDGTAKRRLITALAAEVRVDGDITENESDLTRYPMRATIFPDPSQVSPETGGAKLFDRQFTAAA